MYYRHYFYFAVNLLITTRVFVSVLRVTLFFFVVVFLLCVRVLREGSTAFAGDVY